MPRLARLLTPLAFALCLTALVSTRAFAQPAKPVPVGNCGPKPVVSCSEPPTCVKSPVFGGTWKPGKALPAGSMCTSNTLPTGHPGTCDGHGICDLLPAGPSGIMTPKYFLIAIAYAPPGNASNVLYSNGSTFGTTSSTSKLFGNGLQVGVTGNVILSNTYQTTVTSGTSLQVSKTQANSQQVFSSADALNHMNDEFYIWVHPQFNYSQAWAGAPVDISFVSSSVQTLDPLILNAAELTGQEVIPPQKMAQLLDLTPQDLAQIATQDPFLAPGYQLDPDRFRHVDQVQLVGPDHAGDAAPEMPYSVSDTSLSCQTSTKSWSDTLSVGFSAGADFLGQGEKVQIVGSLTWGGTGSTGNCNGSTQTATFTPHSTTVGFNSVVDVYEDSVYHTFAFTEPTFVQVHVPPAVFSTLKNSAGAPLPHKLITVTFANGSHRRLYTDANGNFTVISPPPGTVTIKSDEGTQKATIRVGANTLPPVILKKPAAKVRHD